MPINNDINSALDRLQKFQYLNVVGFIVNCLTLLVLVFLKN